MLAYAADRRPASHLHPKTLGLILAGHAALLFVVMTARGDISLPPAFDPTDVVFVDPVKPPPPPPPPSDPVKPAESTASRIDQPQIIVPIPQPGPLGPVDRVWLRSCWSSMHCSPWSRSWRAGGSRARRACAPQPRRPVVNVDELRKWRRNGRSSLPMKGTAQRGGSGVSDTMADATPAPPR